VTEEETGGIAVEVQDSGVVVVKMNLGENRFNPTTLDGLEVALDQIEAIDGPSALVLTGEGKFFSNGLDLDWLAAADDQGRRQTLSRVYELFARLVEFPAPTVAAINGHVFAAGAMMALACDWRVMRDDRGFFCLPEADIGLVFVPGMNALITHRLSYGTAREAMLTGRRYNAPDALAAGIVDQVTSEDQVVPASIAIVEPLAAKPQHVQQGIKQGLSAAPIAALRAEAQAALTA